MAELRGEEARHLSRVLRAEPGQRYEITDGRTAHLAEVVEARGERVLFRVLEAVPEPGIPLHVTLCLALIKFDRLEWAIEKATELGVERILPVETARTEKGLRAASQKRSERWMRIVRESSQQSRRVRAPEILPAEGFDAVLGIAADWRCFLDETTAPPLLRVLPPKRGASDAAAMLVGPEGGWTDGERQAAIAAGWQPASLGPLVLRAETAVAAAIGILVNAWIQ